MTPLIGDTSDSIVLYMPSQDFTQSITGNGAEIALDQINSLVANTSCGLQFCVELGFDRSAAARPTSGDAHAGDAIQGDLASGVNTANTSTAATVDAFTQSIVLGANLQNNSFTATIAGTSQETHVGDITSGVSAHGTAN